MGPGMGTGMGTEPGSGLGAMETEVVRHHRVIERWLSGAAGPEEFAVFADAHNPDFALCTPAEVDRKRTPLEIQAVCAPHGIGLLRMVLGGRLEVGGSTTDGRIEVVIRGHNEYALASELAGLVEWLEVTGPPGVRDHLTSIGNALVERYG